MPLDKTLKWIGTITYMIGIALTSANIYPLNLIFQTGGAALWVAAAYVTKDMPLGLLEGYACLTYGIGLGYVIWLAI